jgi:lipid II:glycine glycyltransferase (peptidoglycan interpeptide bridge formation enzyme)
LYRLWLVSLDDTIIAGILCFYWNRHAVAWHGAGLSGYFSYRPNNLLYNHAIMHAAENGYRWFDCNPSSDLSGVSTFKKLIGAQPLQSRVLVRRSQLFRILDLLRFWKVKNR